MKPLVKVQRQMLACLQKADAEQDVGRSQAFATLTNNPELWRFLMRLAEKMAKENDCG